MNAVLLIVALAAAQVFILGLLAGRARGQYGVPAPAMSGHPIFERWTRVHQNSIEQLVVFTPLLPLYANSVGIPTAVVLGVVYLVARVIYALGYVRAPEKRSAGAIMTFIVQGWLIFWTILAFALRLR